MTIPVAWLYSKIAWSKTDTGGWLFFAMLFDFILATIAIEAFS